MVDHLWHFVRERSLEAYYVDAKWSILGQVDERTGEEAS